MNWDDLRIFVAVANHSKLALAASTLRMDETTVSRRIRRLETDLGQTLFERLRRGHHLTPQGQALLEKALQMESAAGSIVSTDDRANAQLSGMIRISAAEGFGAKIIAPVLAAFKKTYPLIDIDLVAGSGFLSLSRREADIAIGLSRSKSNRIQSSRLLDYTLGLYASEGWLLENSSPKSIDDIQDTSIIGYIDDLIYANELRYLEEILPRAVASLRSSSILSQVEMTKNAAGLAILPKFLAEPELVRLLPNVINIKRTFWFSVHKEIADNARIKALIDFLPHEIAALDQSF